MKFSTRDWKVIVPFLILCVSFAVLPLNLDGRRWTVGKATIEPPSAGSCCSSSCLAKYERNVSGFSQQQQDTHQGIAEQRWVEVATIRRHQRPVCDTASGRALASANQLIRDTRPTATPDVPTRRPPAVSLTTSLVPYVNSSL